MKKFAIAIILVMLLTGLAWADPGITATKQLSYIGINGGSVISAESISVNSFCNRVEAGSTIDMTIANVRTTSQSGFVASPADYPLELDHAILVTEYVPGIPSQGMASAFIDTLILEGRGDGTSLMEQIRFEEYTSVKGNITVFDKLMHYESLIVR